MARSPFTKRGVSRTESQGVVPVRGGGFTFRPGLDQTLPTSDALRNITKDLDDFLGLIDTTAEDLINRGRAEAATSIRTLGDRLKRTANRRGVSSEQIARQIADATNKLNSQQGLFESKVLSDKLANISNTISKKAGIEQGAFSQDLQRASFRENVLRNMEQDPERPTTNPLRSRSVQRDRLVDRARRTPIRSMARTDAAMSERGRNFADTMRIAKSLDARDTAMQRAHPLFTPSGSQANTARAGLAVTQMNRGQRVGLFQPREARPQPRVVGFAPRSPIAPANTGGMRKFF